MKPYLVGECPSKRGDRYWRTPLGQVLAQRLCQLADIRSSTDATHHDEWTDALYQRYCAVNLIERHVTPWPADQAANSAFDLEEKIAAGPAVGVLCGRRVADAFGVRATFNTWVVTRAGLLVVIPHPSGRNRTLNDPDMRWLAGKSLREAIVMTG